MWSSVTIPGKPNILIVDGSCNLEGWEHDFTDRLYSSFQRSGLDLFGEKAHRVQHPQQLEAFKARNWNCIVVLAYGQADDAPDATMIAYWDWLQNHATGPKVFAACMFHRYNEAVSQEVLRAQPTFAPIALAQQSTATPRETGLLLLKF